MLGSHGDEPFPGFELVFPMALLVLFAALLLKTALQAVGQSAGAPPTPPADFLSIDCGLEGSAYNDSATGIAYVPDGQYVDSGENHRIAGDKATTKTDLRTLQSFPSGLRNCYTLPTRTGRKYLVRLLFFYGDYDGKDSASTLRFDLHLGPYPWVTVDKAGDQVYEAVFMAWARWTPVCLINTGGGTPFVSRVDLRPLGDALYPEVMANQSMAMYLRRSMGDNANYITRYPDDPYDRYWWQMWSNTTWKNISTTSNVQKDSSYAEPLPVLQTAVETSDNKTTLSITWEDKTPRCHDLKLLMHFADFQKSQLRQFNVSFLDGKPYQHSPAYLTSETLYNTGWSKATDDGKYYINLVPTAASKLPPMINALEIYTLISHDSPSTFQPDYETIMAIKLEYGIKKNWMGDPCFPVKFVWEGVKCSSADNNTARIISLDLSNSNLHGAISTNFTLLTALQYLNLSCNQLNGSVPESLRKNNTASFVFSYDSDGNMCNNPKLTPVSTGKKSNRTIILAISVAVPVMVIAVLVSVFFIWRQKRKPNLSTDDPPRIQPELNDDPEIKKNHGGALQMVENRQFTYHELEKVTNKFQRLIGQGGFGPVYYGHLEDYTEVAVKMRSESSSHGLNEFFAEVQSLTKVHHRNLVSLVGYCWDKEHLALVYEYMVRGSLCDQLRGNNAATETMTWRTRVGVAVEAAQGLDYLHKGCSLPIIHRDVKTSNILLGQNLQAKIADFGLSKTYLSETQTHISVTAAGTAGYIDPEYYQTGRLTESSDVYSFGIVLLEIATGEPPIVPGQGHIVQNVKKKIGSGNIGLIVDARLRGAYDVSSMWKVVDIALLCTTDVAAQRPTMAVVVTQLKESLALEEARVNSGFMGSTSTMSDTTYSMSTFSPLAR